MFPPAQSPWRRRPLRPPSPASAWLYLLPFFVIVLFVVASPGCEQSDLPKTAGDYPIHNNEIRFDGKDYIFRWVDRDQSLHPVETDDIKLAQDEATFLRVNGGGTLHLAQNQQVRVDARD